MKVCRCDAYHFPHRFGGGDCKGPYLCEHGVDEREQECEECIIDREMHPDEDQVPRGYIPHYISLEVER